MTVISRLYQLHQDQKANKKGYLVVSEKEWNSYYRVCGVKHWYAFSAGLSMNTLSFKGCQLRVL